MEEVMAVDMLETTAFQPHPSKMLANSPPWLPSKGSNPVWILVKRGATLVIRAVFLFPIIYDTWLLMITAYLPEPLGTPLLDFALRTSIIVL